MRTRSVIARAAIASALLLGLLEGCPNPSAQYQDYISITADKRSVISADASVVPVADAKPPTEVIEGTYLATCYTVLSNDETRVLRFYTDMKFLPEATGGKLTLKMTAFKGWDAVAAAPKPPATFSRSETIGDSINAADVTVTGAQFSADLGKIDVLGDANTISGRAITLDPVLLQGIIDGNAKPASGGGGDAGAGEGGGAGEAGTSGTGSFCAGLGGKVTKPIDVTLSPGDGSNICLFRYQKEGEPLILHKLDDFKKSPCAPH